MFVINTIIKLISNDHPKLDQEEMEKIYAQIIDPNIYIEIAGLFQQFTKP